MVRGHQVELEAWITFYLITINLRERERERERERVRVSDSKRESQLQCYERLHSFAGYNNICKIRVFVKHMHTSILVVTVAW